MELPQNMPRERLLAFMKQRLALDPQAVADMCRSPLHPNVRSCCMELGLQTALAVKPPDVHDDGLDRTADGGIKM